MGWFAADLQLTAEERIHRRVTFDQLLIQFLQQRSPHRKFRVTHQPGQAAWLHLDEQTFHLAISYALPYALAVWSNSPLGIDVVLTDDFEKISIAERVQLAQTFFSPPVNDTLKRDSYDTLAYAVAWSQLEAQCKFNQIPLSEWSPERDKVLRAPGLASQTFQLKAQIGCLSWAYTQSVPVP